MITSLSRFLAGLRGEVSVEELAKQAGSAASTIYKAESGAAVKWETILQIYGQWLTSRDLKTHCLFLWAAARAGIQDDAKGLEETFGRMMEDDPDYCAKSSGLTPTERGMLERFSKAFIESEWVRGIARQTVELHDSLMARSLKPQMDKDVHE